MSTNVINYNMVNKTQWTSLLRVTQKLHKINKNLEFLGNCQRYRVLPKFTFFTQKTIVAAQLSPERVRQLRWTKVSRCIENSENSKIYNYKKLTSYLNNLNLTRSEYGEIKAKLFSEASKIEQNGDLRRDEIFNYLVKTQNIDSAKIDVNIPENVFDVLKFGL